MTLSARSASALGLLLGYAADRLLGDPRRWHPVAGFGALAAAVERRTYADHRAAGAAHVAALVGGATLLGIGVERLCRDRLSRRLSIALTAAATWVVLGGRSLQDEAGRVADQLVRGDLTAARQQIRSLVGRDPSSLESAELARACVESLAENTADAVVAPLFWGGLAGVPGLLGYRAVNTLDAMIGHRSARYARFGWAAARLDDLANWLPARLCAGLTVLAAPLVAGSPLHTLRVVARDAGRHPSPNAGPVEAAFAGALGVRLGGRNRYQDRVEVRGPLGDGPPAAVADIARAARLTAVVGGAAAGIAVLVRVTGRRR